MRIIIADDNRKYRSLIRQALERYAGYEIVGEAEDGLKTLELLDLISIDVLLLDIEMPRMNGIEVLRKLKDSNRDPRVLLISSYLDPYFIEEALRLGARGYLLKEDAIYELSEAVYFVHRNPDHEVYLSQTVRNILTR